MLDNFGLQPLNATVHIALLHILANRYGKQAIIVTSRLPVSKWYDVIKDPTLTDVLMDRLTANAHRIELDGETLKRKKACVFLYFFL